MVKATEKEPVTETPVSPEEVAAARCSKAIPAMISLVEQFHKLPVPYCRDFVFFGWPAALLTLLSQRTGDGYAHLPVTGDDLLAFLKLPATIRELRSGGRILVSLEPAPHSRRGGKEETMIRLERAAPVEDRHIERPATSPGSKERN